MKCKDKFVFYIFKFLDLASFIKIYLFLAENIETFKYFN